MDETEIQDLDETKSTSFESVSHDLFKTILSFIIFSRWKLFKHKKRTSIVIRQFKKIATWLINLGLKGLYWQQAQQLSLKIT